MDLLTPHFGVFFWQFVTILLVLIILKVFPFKVMSKSLEDRKKAIDSSIANSNEIEERLKNMKTLEENLQIELSEKREKMLNELKVLREEYINKLYVEMSKKKQEIEKSVREECEGKAGEFLDRSYNILVKNSMIFVEKFFYDNLSGQKDNNICIRALVDKLSKEFDKSKEQIGVC